MALRKIKLGELIEQVSELNSELKYGLNDVMGMTLTKEIIPTKADINPKELPKFIIVSKNDFIFNPRTHGKKIGFGFNDNDKKFLISWNNIAFRVKENKKDLLLPYYLWIWLKRDEWDRFATFNSWGSSTEVFSWDILYDMDIELPDLPTQQKYVDVYLSMIKNQKAYERGVEDLKLVYDGLIDKLKHKNNLVEIGNYIIQTDNRNVDNHAYRFAGLSMENYFIDSIADANELDFKKYKIVAPNEYGAVLMKVGRDCRLTIARNISTENYLISPAYYSFKTHDIVPEYFMANVNRSEFERRGWFSCDSSTRGSLSWDEFMKLKIPYASEEMQDIIKKLYNVYLLRIEINDKLKKQIKNICPILIKGSINEAKEV